MDSPLHFTDPNVEKSYRRRRRCIGAFSYRIDIAKNPSYVTNVFCILTGAMMANIEIYLRELQKTKLTLSDAMSICFPKNFPSNVILLADEIAKLLDCEIQYRSKSNFRSGTPDTVRLRDAFSELARLTQDNECQSKLRECSTMLDSLIDERDL